MATGAEAVHLHPRRGDGTESLLAADVAAAVAAMRRACPGTPVGISTGLWIAGGDPRARWSAVAAWAGLPRSARPDFASVNIGEPGSADLPGLLQSLGIAVEAGVWSVADTALLAAAEPAAGWLRILVEIIDAPPATAPATASEILHHLGTLGVAAPRLLHGKDSPAGPWSRTRARWGCPPGSAWKTPPAARMAPRSAATPS